MQSHVPEHTELAWVMTCLASFGEVFRLPKANFAKAGARVMEALRLLPPRGTSWTS